MTSVTFQIITWRSVEQDYRTGLIKIKLIND